MDRISLSDLNLLDIGNTIQLTGAVYSGHGKNYLVILPDEHDIQEKECTWLPMTLEEWEKFLRQTDLLETEILRDDGHGLKKAIVRKTQRQIDGALQARVWRRDGYRCRYCGREEVQLTVDHVVLWEEGGPTVEENLLSCCKKCNRTRGNIQYPDWLNSRGYKERSAGLTEEQKRANEDVATKIPHLRTLTISHLRSR